MICFSLSIPFCYVLLSVPVPLKLPLQEINELSHLIWSVRTHRASYAEQQRPLWPQAVITGWRLTEFAFKKTVLNWCSSKWWILLIASLTRECFSGCRPGQLITRHNYLLIKKWERTFRMNVEYWKTFRFSRPGTFLENYLESIQISATFIMLKIMLRQLWEFFFQIK